MFPYRFDEGEDGQQAAAPAPSQDSASRAAPVSSPAPAPQPAPATRRARPWRQSALLAFALAAGATGGAIAGPLVASRAQAPQTVSAAVGAAQPVSAQQQVVTVARDVYSKVGGAVVEIRVSGEANGDPMSY